MLVDFYLRNLERDLLRELVRIERTPFPATLIVSALSQMWIFAVYELLRTWRQRIKDLKREPQKPPVAVTPTVKPDLAGLWYRKQLERLRKEPTYAKDLDRAMTRVEPFFRRIEALRMNLAKHEVPKTAGVPALAPGYGRIDRFNGSISWQIDLGDNAVDLVSRRSIADQLRNVVLGRGARTKLKTQGANQLFRKATMN